MSSKYIVVDVECDLFEVSGDDPDFGKYIGSLLPHQFINQQSSIGLFFSVENSLGVLTKERVQGALDNLDVIEKNIKEHREFLRELKYCYFSQVS